MILVKCIRLARCIGLAHERIIGKHFFRKKSFLSKEVVSFEKNCSFRKKSFLSKEVVSLKRSRACKNSFLSKEVVPFERSRFFRESKEVVSCGKSRFFRKMSFLSEKVVSLKRSRFCKELFLSKEVVSFERSRFFRKSEEVASFGTRNMQIVVLRGGGLGSRPKKMYGERLGDGVEYHLMKPTPRR